MVAAGISVLSPLSVANFMLCCLLKESRSKRKVWTTYLVRCPFDLSRCEKVCLWLRKVWNFKFKNLKFQRESVTKANDKTFEKVTKLNILCEWLKSLIRWHIVNRGHLTVYSGVSAHDKFYCCRSWFSLEQNCWFIEDEFFNESTVLFQRKSTSTITTTEWEIYIKFYCILLCESFIWTSR